MSNKLSLHYILNDIIKNHFLNLIKINLFCAVIIFIVYTFLPKTYYADTSLTLSGNSTDSIFGNTRSLANTVGINLPNNSFSDFFYIPNIIYSKSCIESVILKQRNINGEIISLHDFWTSKRSFISGKSEQQLLHDSIIKFEERIIIDEDFKSGMFTIGFHSSFEELSIDIIQDLTDYINNFINDTASEKSSSLSGLYNRKLSIFKEKLTFAEESLKNFAEKNKNYQNSPELLIEFERLNRQVVLENDRYLNVFVQNTLTEIEEEKNVPKINILSKPYIHPEVYSPDLLLMLLVGLSIVNVCFLTIYVNRTQID